MEAQKINFGTNGVHIRDTDASIAAFCTEFGGTNPMGLVPGKNPKCCYICLYIFHKALF